MVIAIKHEDMSNTHQCNFFENIEHFAEANFKIEITEDGDVIIDGKSEQTISYKIGTNNNDYTLLSAKYAFINSAHFRKHARRHFWTVYLIKEKVI